MAQGWSVIGSILLQPTELRLLMYIGIKEDVLRLEVSVDHIHRMKVLQREEHLYIHYIQNLHTYPCIQYIQYIHKYIHKYINT